MYLIFQIGFTIDSKIRLNGRMKKRFKVLKNFQLAFKDKNRSHHFYTLTNLEHSHGTGATNLAWLLIVIFKLLTILQAEPYMETNVGRYFLSFYLIISKLQKSKIARSPQCDLAIEFLARPSYLSADNCQMTPN